MKNNTHTVTTSLAFLLTLRFRSSCKPSGIKKTLEIEIRKNNVRNVRETLLEFSSFEMLLQWSFLESKYEEEEKEIECGSEREGHASLSKREKGVVVFVEC